MEYHTYNSLYETIKYQYSKIQKPPKTQEQLNLENTYNFAYDIYNNPSIDNIMNKIKNEINKEKIQNKDDIDTYVYIAKNYT